MSDDVYTVKLRLRQWFAKKNVHTETLIETLAQREVDNDRLRAKIKHALEFKRSAIDQLKMHSARREAAERQLRQLRGRMLRRTQVEDHGLCECGKPISLASTDTLSGQCSSYYKHGRPCAVCGVFISLDAEGRGETAFFTVSKTESRTTWAAHTVCLEWLSRVG